jgi:TolB protein
MKKQKILVMIFCLLFSIFNFQTIIAQTEVYVKMPVGGSEPLDIAVTDFSPKKKGFSADEKSWSFQIPQIIRADLDFSLLFYVTEIDSFARSVVGADPLNFDGWFKLGVQMVLSGEVEQKGDEIRADVSLYDVVKSKKIYSESYKTSSDNVRGLAHTISDDVVFKLTGDKGIFNTRIAFVSSRTGNKEIYICDFDGFNSKKVTSDKSIDLSPRWSPDSKKIIYTSYKKGNPDLWIRDLQTGTDQVLSAQAGLNSAASWSPDGKYISLVLSKGGG